jgi:hypothetical protein
MPQNVPAFEFSAEAKQLRQFVYEYWCRWGRGPNLRAAHEGTGLPKRRIAQAYKELQLGIICVVDQASQNCNLLKFQPFSSYPSQVEVWLEGQFHSYAGCAMEAVAVSRMPPFEGKQITLESYCACCLAPITLDALDGAITPDDGALVHVSSSPYDWNNDDIQSMCDSMNFVIDADHADRYERQVSRRGVLLDLQQARAFVSRTADERMWHYDWKPGILTPHVVIKGFEALGVDVGNWIGDKAPLPDDA